MQHIRFVGPVRQPDFVFGHCHVTKGKKSH